jgi:hypothetical protein
MRLMVTGSRDWRDGWLICLVLNDFYWQHHGERVTLLHGDQRGADTIADAQGRMLGWTTESYPADWKTHGKKAGPIRNAEMIATKPDLVLAFPLPGSKGTWDAIEKAEAASIKVIIPYPELAGERNR